MKSEKNDQKELKENSDSDDQDTEYPHFPIQKDTEYPHFPIQKDTEYPHFPVEKDTEYPHFPVEKDSKYPYFPHIEKDSNWLAQLDSDGDGKIDVFQQSSCTTKMNRGQSFTCHVLYCGALPATVKGIVDYHIDFDYHM